MEEKRIKEEKILKKLNELRAEKKLIVGVKQNGFFVNLWEDEKTNVLQLTAFLYRKTLLKSKISVTYSYNYSDLQTIKVVEKYENYDGTITKTEFYFYNVPTNLGYLDMYKLKEKMEDAKNEI